MQASHKYSNEEIDLRTLISILWVERKQLSGIIAVFVMASIIAILVLPEIYRAESVLISAEERQPSNSLINQYGGAATLLGLNLGGGNSDRVGAAIAVMNSREFIGRFIDNHGLLVPLFAGTWDKGAGVSGIDDAIYNEANSTWQLEQGRPTELEAIREFQKILRVSGPSRDAGLVRVSIDWHDPILASQWVNLFVEDINSTIKQSEVTEATSAIAYLRSQLETTQLVEMQRVFNQLIESQMRIVMLADVRDEYVFRTIDPAVIPDRSVAPNTLFIILLGTMSGVLFAVLYILFRRTYMSPQES